MPRLLIVDDQLHLREVLKAVFEDNFEVKTAANGLEALEILAVWQPDVMITDYAMPAMAGLELVRAIAEMKNRESSNEFKIILCSACLTNEIRLKAKSLGVVVCLDKPFDLDELKGWVKGKRKTEIKGLGLAMQ